MERIAKRIARAGVASRREAEQLISVGEVKMNGTVVTTPVTFVKPTDQISVSGKMLEAADRTRLWLYHKPRGLITTHRDEKNRPTIFDNLPANLPRVISVGRLDLNSEGLLLLTNDGALKRQLELPQTGWLRRYRVRARGEISEAGLARLRAGMKLDGIQFRPMQVEIDQVRGSNTWLTLGLREGKNREIRRALSELAMEVNRLIRISYGPFRLGDLKQGEAEHIPAKVLADQLGKLAPPPQSTKI